MMVKFMPLVGTSTSRTIKARIVNLLALVMLPLIGLYAWSSMNYAAVKRELIELQRLDVTKRLTTAMDRDVSIQIGMLRGLSDSDDLSETNLAGFQRHASNLAKRPHVSRIWAFDRLGRAVPGTAAGKNAQDRSVPPLPNEMVARIFAGYTAVSGVTGEGVRQASAVIAVPVIHNGSVKFGVAAQIFVAHLSDLFAEAGMKDDWAAAVVDRDGKFVARSLDKDRRLGKPARPELAEVARSQKNVGTFENVTLEGMTGANAFQRSSFTGWTSVVAVPKAELTRPLWQALFLILFAGAGTLIATILLALRVSERISGPVQSLRRLAASGVGHATPDTVYHIKELDEVRTALENAIAEGAWLSALVASSGDAIMSIGLDGTIKTWNKGAEDLFGWRSEEAIGRPKTVIVPQDRLLEFEAQRDRILQGSAVRAETTRCRRDGTLIHVSLNAAPIRSRDGHVVAISSILHDITDRKDAEEHNRLLNREISHRSKNQLAVIQSIAGRTARQSTSVDHFLETFGHRLQGLAASHDLLSNQDWRGAYLQDLVHRHTEIFGVKERVITAGPDVLLNSSGAEAIGLAVHELVTNSTKYGALSNATGNVHVKWRVETEADGKKHLKLDWTESGGPEVAPPKIKGFGSQVIEKLVASTVNGVSTLRYTPAGVEWHLDCPLET